MRIYDSLTTPPAPSTAQIDTLIDAATTTDGIAPLSEQFLRGLRENLGHTHLVAVIDDAPAAVAAHDGATTELVVHPAYRRRGIATALLDQLSRTLPQPPRVWAHGNLPAAKQLAGRFGWASTRELLVMSAELNHADLDLPADMLCLDLDESIARHGRDTTLDAWLKANNEAFSWHPEQGGWDRARLDTAMAATWFNPKDVLLVWDGAELVGFHWTKHHPHNTGEVYVVGLAADYRGRGLGGPLVQLGLNHLANAGNTHVILYVEADNTPAVRAYEKLGFTTTEQHVLYTPTTKDNQ